MEGFKEHLVWIKKAKDDLLWAENSMNGGVWYGACFVAQQAGEKALKAYIIAKLNKLMKTHDLRVLLTECITQDESFEQLRSGTDCLQPYYLQTRYPDWSNDSITEDQAREAYLSAKMIVGTIDSLLVKG